MKSERVFLLVHPVNNRKWCYFQKKFGRGLILFYIHKYFFFLLFPKISQNLPEHVPGKRLVGKDRFFPIKMGMSKDFFAPIFWVFSSPVLFPGNCIENWYKKCFRLNNVRYEGKISHQPYSPFR